MILPEAPNQRWSLNFVSDALNNGRRFRVMAVVDDFTRECLALVIDTSLSDLRVGRELDRITELDWRRNMARHLPLKWRNGSFHHMTYVAATGTARIRQAGTGEIFEIDSTELDFEAVSADERNMGPEIHHQAAMEHPGLGTLVWDLWEYPVGMENMQETDVGEHELLQNINFRLEHGPDDNDEPPEEPPNLKELLMRLPGQLATLDAALDRLTQPSGLIGHNMPPLEFRLKLDDEGIARLRESIVAVQGELDKQDAAVAANPAILTISRDRLMGFGSRLSGLGKWAGVTVGAGMLTGFGKEISEQIWIETPTLHLLVQVIVQSLSVWIHVLMNLL